MVFTKNGYLFGHLSKEFHHQGKVILKQSYKQNQLKSYMRKFSKTHGSPYSGFLGVLSILNLTANMIIVEKAVCKRLTKDIGIIAEHRGVFYIVHLDTIDTTTIKQCLISMQMNAMIRFANGTNKLAISRSPKLLFN